MLRRESISLAGYAFRVSIWICAILIWAAASSHATLEADKKGMLVFTVKSKPITGTSSSSSYQRPRLSKGSKSSGRSENNSGVLALLRSLTKGRGGRRRDRRQLYRRAYDLLARLRNVINTLERANRERRRRRGRNGSGGRGRRERRWRDFDDFNDFRPTKGYASVRMHERRSRRREGSYNSDYSRRGNYNSRGSRQGQGRGYIGEPLDRHGVFHIPANVIKAKLRMKWIPDLFNMLTGTYRRRGGQFNRNGRGNRGGGGRGAGQRGRGAGQRERGAGQRGRGAGQRGRGAGQRGRGAGQRGRGAGQRGRGAGTRGGGAGTRGGGGRGGRPNNRGGTGGRQRRAKREVSAFLPMSEESMQTTKREVDVTENDKSADKRTISKVDPVAILITIHKLKQKVEAGLETEDRYRTAIKVAMRKLLKTYDSLKQNHWKPDPDKILPADATVTPTDDKHLNLVLKADVIAPKNNTQQAQQTENKTPPERPGVLVTSVTAVKKKPS